MTNAFDLTGKVILLTGGCGFLGQLFTKALREAGATVVVTDISGRPAIRLDVTDPDSIARAFKKTVSQHKNIDVVINNAAIDPKFDQTADPNIYRFENYPDALLKQSLDVNIRGYVLVTQAAVKHMLKHKSGLIINISSIYGLVAPRQDIYPAGTQKPADYSLTKGAVNLLTKWIAATYGRQGIRANTYTLGGVRKDHSAAWQKTYGTYTPLGRMVDPSEVGGPLVFLCADASAGMTGANLIVDGGWTCW